MQITFHCHLISNSNIILPYNYHYPLYSAIKQAINNIDSTYFVEREGLIDTWVLSPITCLFANKEEGLSLLTPSLSFSIRTLDNDLLSLIYSVIQEGHIFNLNDFRFEVDQVIIKPVIFSENARFRMDVPGINLNGKYCPIPGTEKFNTLFFNNIIKKYKAIYSEDIKNDNFVINILNEPRRKVVKIKEGGIPTYTFDFTLNCPKKLINVGVCCGFGTRTSLGLGFVKF